MLRGLPSIVTSPTIAELPAAQAMEHSDAYVKGFGNCNVECGREKPHGVIAMHANRQPRIHSVQILLDLDCPHMFIVEDWRRYLQPCRGRFFP